MKHVWGMPFHRVHDDSTSNTCLRTFSAQDLECSHTCTHITVNPWIQFNSCLDERCPLNESPLTSMLKSIDIPSCSFVPNFRWKVNDPSDESMTTCLSVVRISLLHVRSVFFFGKRVCSQQPEKVKVKVGKSLILRWRRNTQYSATNFRYKLHLAGYLLTRKAAHL